MAVLEYGAKLSLGSCLTLWSSVPQWQETDSFIKHCGRGVVCAVLFNPHSILVKCRFYFPVLLMRKLGIERLGHLPKIPAVEPGFKCRLRDLSCGPYTTSLFSVPHCASAAPPSEWPQPSSVGERDRSMGGGRSWAGCLNRPQGH